MGLPVVDDNGQAEGLCQLQLAVEHVLLESPGRVVLPVVIQADLSDGPHLGAGGQLPQLQQGPLPPFSAVGGVDPHRGVDMGKFLCQGHCGAGALQVAARVDDQLHPLLGHRGQKFLPVGVEGPGVVVGMGIKIHEMIPYSAVKYTTYRSPTDSSS